MVYEIYPCKLLIWSQHVEESKFQCCRLETCTERCGMWNQSWLCH
jgi:hypothetical protein